MEAHEVAMVDQVGAKFREMQELAQETNVQLIQMAKQRLAWEQQGDIHAISTQGEQVVRILRETPAEVFPIMVTDLVIALVQVGQALAESRNREGS